jgi:hypothetical protein
MSYERLFIVRCEALLSQITNGSNLSQTLTNVNNNDNTNSMIKIILNDDMSISFVSSNINDVLGYSRTEMIGNWFGRYLTTNDLEKFENIRNKYFQFEEEQLPTSICDIFDIYTNNGEGRLTFLCQIRTIRERRSKLIKYSFIAQLIDPSLRSEYAEYVESQSKPSKQASKVDQHQHQYQKRAKSQSWPIVPHSTKVSSYSNISTISTIFNMNNLHHSLEHSPMLLHRSTSMTNLGENYSILDIQHK